MVGAWCDGPNKRLLEPGVCYAQNGLGLQIRLHNYGAGRYTYKGQDDIQAKRTSVEPDSVISIHRRGAA
jgi:hypothetical protein